MRAFLQWYESYLPVLPSSASKGGLPLDSHWSHDLAKGNKQISASLNATSHSIRTQSATRQIFVATLVKWSENGLESVEQLSQKFLKVV